MPELTEAEKQQWRDRINKMDRTEMARLHHFAPAGHPLFDSRYDLCVAFQARFNTLGGMTPAISKSPG